MLCSFSLYFRFGEIPELACLPKGVAWVECERRRTHCCSSIQHSVQGEILQPISECERVYRDDLYVLCAHPEITTGDVDFDAGSIGRPPRWPPRADRARVGHELSDFRACSKGRFNSHRGYHCVVRTNFKCAHVFAGMRNDQIFRILSSHETMPFIVMLQRSAEK